MRGEETELIGLINKLNIDSECIVILPGSHCKFILLDNNQNIVSSLTTLSGELLSALTQNTILSDSLKFSFVKVLNKDMVLKGARFVEEYGFIRACFIIRLMERELGLSQNDNASFLLEAVTYLDIDALKKHSEFRDIGEKRIILAGNEIVTEAFKILLNEEQYFKGKVQSVALETIKSLSAYGAMIIASKRGLL